MGKKGRRGRGGEGGWREGGRGVRRGWKTEGREEASGEVDVEGGGTAGW